MRKRYERWRDARRKRGQSTFTVHFSPSRLRKLSRAKTRELVSMLRTGSLADRHAHQLWTTARVAEVIWKNFSVRDHRDHVGRLLHALR